MTIKDTLYIPDMGIVCALGLGKEAVARSLFYNDDFTCNDYDKLIGGNVIPIRSVSQELLSLPDGFNDLDSRNNRLLQLALEEILKTVEATKKKYGSHRIGVIMATSTSGMSEGEEAFTKRQQTGSWPETYHYSIQETASPSLFASRYFGVSGPSYTISTACSSGSKALCSAQRLIHAGICDAVIVGGVDSLCQLTLNGFDSLELISKTICNPLSKHRSGITIGEGAAVFLLSKDPSPIEFAGGGESSDAYHISSPAPQGEGAEAAIREALKAANLKPEDITYINLHGTGTELNDSIESHCVYRIFKDRVPCSSTKALTGHTLGASGAIEAAFLWLSLFHEDLGSIPLPPHIWDGEVDTDLAPLTLTKRGERAYAHSKGFALMSNSFAFGGSNVSIILRKRSHG